MLYSEHKRKILEKVKELKANQMLLITHKIASKCIRLAKTPEARERLVYTAIWINSEDCRRMWMDATQSVMDKIPNSLPKMTKKSMFQTMKGWFI